MRRRITLLLPMVGAIAACLGMPLESLDDLGDRLARTTCAATAADIETVANAHVEGQKDRLETRRCAAGRSTIYVGRTTSDPSGLPVAVEITAPGAGLPQHLEIGQPVHQVTQLLGPPAEQTRDALTYGLGTEGVDAVTIRHAEGKITSAQWTWVVD